MFVEYSRIVSEAKYKAKYGEGLKILTPKQMLLALAQVKVYSLYWKKEITKKVYNNIMNSMKL